MKRRYWFGLRACLVTSLSWCALGCSGEKAPSKGQIMLALQTDMSIPEDVTHIKIIVFKNGSLKFEQKYRVGPEGEDIPATLGVIASEDPEDTMEARVLAYRGSVVRTLNRAVTTIPEDRVATMRIPIQWLCDNQVRPIEGLADTYESTCPDPDQVCIAGECRDAEVESEILPDFQIADITGGAVDPTQGLCFETSDCFDRGTNVPVEAGCRLRLAGAEHERLNVGLLLPDDQGGICSKTSGNCYIPLDHSEDYGWRVVTDQAGVKDSETLVQLPTAVCAKLSSGDAAAVRVTGACATKTETIPTCGIWTSIGENNAERGPLPDSEMHPGMTPGPAPVTPEPTTPDPEIPTIPEVPGPEMPKDPECPALYGGEPEGPIASDPEVDRYARLILELVRQSNRMKIEVGTGCSTINERVGGTPSTFADVVPTEAELATACSDARAQLISGSTRPHVQLGTGYCRANTTAQIEGESACPEIADCTFPTTDERCGGKLWTCADECTGECLPSPMTLELGCMGTCSGQCNGTCSGACTGPDGNALPSTSCHGYCTGTCAGSCQGTCSGHGTCTGVCRGACEGSVIDALCETPLTLPECALQSSCKQLSAAEAGLRQQCIATASFVTGASDSKVAEAIRTSFPRLLLVIEESKGLSTALSHLTVASSQIFGRIDVTSNDGACLTESTALLAPASMGIGSASTDAHLVLSAIERGAPATDVCTPSTGDDTCNICVKASCCAQYRACSLSGTCQFEGPCMQSCRMRGDPPALCRSQCAMNGGTLDPVTQAFADCLSNYCTLCAPPSRACLSSGAAGFNVDDFEDADLQGPLGPWRLNNRTDFAGSLGWMMPGFADSTAALAAIGTPDPGLSVDFWTCVDATNSSGIGLSLQASSPNLPINVEVQLRTNETESRDLGGNCTTLCGDHYRASLSLPRQSFEAFVVPWSAFRNSLESGPQLTNIVGLDFIGRPAADQLAIDDVRFEPFHAGGSGSK